MFIIRADGNAKIGAGHLMRCLTIAEAVRKLPDAPEILVLCADADSGKMASDRGFETGVFHTDYQQMEEELPLWKQWIKDETNSILVDSYHATDRYLAALKSFGRVCLMDDMQNHAYPADVVINYNVFADEAVYKRLYASQEGLSQFYLGGSYAPLREQFQNVDYRVKEKVGQVLLTTGAGDADNIAGAIMDRICEVNSYTDDMIFHVLVGRFSPHLAAWQERALKHPNIRVHFDVQDMAGLMKQCDLAITAGGSTVYELSAVGVPLIAFAYAENQELLVDYLRARDRAGSAGEWHREKSSTRERIGDLFEKFCGDYDLRKYYSERERELVDGCGAERLARKLCMEETDI